MRFTQAWADIASQNLYLKAALLCLSISTVVLGIATAKLSMKVPLIIDRACYSKGVLPGSVTRSPEEIDSFVRLAVAERFDSDNREGTGFLSPEEAAFRLQEQKELSMKNISQKIIVNSIVVDGNNVTVNSDRLISTGIIRSAFIFPLKITLATVERTSANPYGLILVKSANDQKKGGNDDSK